MQSGVARGCEGKLASLHDKEIQVFSITADPAAFSSVCFVVER